MTGWLSQPLVLEGRVVRLEPLTSAHVPALSEVALDPELWRWTLSVIQTVDDLRRYVDAALAARAAGTSYPFATVDRASGRVVGTTRFCSLETAHRKVEIGYTFVAPAWQRTPVNTEAKLLMLRHAFDVLGMNRVEFKTDALNEKSRAALLRLGATEEGTLRAHLVTERGRIRDSVYYSVLASEWPAVQTRLEQRLSSARPA